MQHDLWSPEMPSIRYKVWTKFLIIEEELPTLRKARGLLLQGRGNIRMKAQSLSSQKWIEICRMIVSFCWSLFSFIGCEEKNRNSKWRLRKLGKQWSHSISFTTQFSLENGSSISRFIFIQFLDLFILSTNLIITIIAYCLE